MQLICSILIDVGVLHLKKLCYMFYHTCFQIFYCTCFYMFYHTCFYMFYHTHFLHVLSYTFSEIVDRNWNYKGVKLPSGCVVPGSMSFHTFGCCFVNWRGVLMRCTIQAFWSSWVEHHARLVQGLWNWQVWAASPPATFVLHLEFRVQFWLLHSCVQFAVSADWEAQGKRVPSP